MSLAVFLSGLPPHQGGRQPLASPWLVAAVRPVTMATMDQIMDYLFSFVELFSGFRGSDVCVCVWWQRTRVWGESAETWNSKWWISGLFASQRRRFFSPALKNLIGFYRVLLLLLLFLFQIYFFCTDVLWTRNTPHQEIYVIVAKFNCSSFLFCLPVLVNCSKNYNTHEHQQMSVWVLLAVGLHVTSVYEQTTFTWLHRRHFTVINLTKTQNDSASHQHASCKQLSLIKSIK